MDAALRELNAFSPTVRFGTFATTPGVQDYAIFSANSESYVSGTENALGVSNAWYNAGSSFDSLDLFSPYTWLWQDLGTNLAGRLNNVFDYPSQIVMFRQSLASFERQFGTQGFQVFGAAGGEDSILRLNTVPTGYGSVLVEYTVGVTLASFPSLNLGNGRRLMQWILHFAAEAVANRLFETAGLDIAGFKVNDAAAKRWERKATTYKDEAIASQGGVYSGIASRT